MFAMYCMFGDWRVGIGLRKTGFLLFNWNRWDRYLPDFSPIVCNSTMENTRRKELLSNAFCCCCVWVKINSHAAQRCDSMVALEVLALAIYICVHNDFVLDGTQSTGIIATDAQTLCSVTEENREPFLARSIRWMFVSIATYTHISFTRVR